MKKITILLFLPLILCIFCGMAPTPVYTLTGFKEQLEPYWKKVIILEENEELSSSLLPQYMLYECNGEGFALPVTWDIDDETLSVPGLHYACGTPVLAEDTILAEEFDGIATWPVFRKGENAAFPVIPETPYINYPMVSLNGNPEEELLIQTPSNKFLVGNDGYVDAVMPPVWQWDYSAIDTSATGRYTLTGIPQFPEIFSLPDNYQINLTVYVLPADRIELYGPASLVGQNSRLEITWLYPSVQVSDPVLEILSENGSWNPCDPSWYGFSKNKLSLNLIKFPLDTTYTIRLRYTDVLNNETMEQLTDPVILTIPADLANAQESELINGDRDGSDTETELPDYEQPAPEPEDKIFENDASESETFESEVFENEIIDTPPIVIPQKEGSDKNPEDISQPTIPEIPSEVVTDTYTAISGLRLKKLQNTSSTVLFEMQGISLEIPSALLGSLSLQDYDLFEVSLLHPQKNAVSVSIFINGTPISDLSGSRLYIPSATGTVLLEIDSPGTYFIEAENIADELLVDSETELESSEDASDNTKISLMTVLVFLLLMLIVWLLYRRWQYDKT